MGHCREALRVRRELDGELADAAERTGQDLMWTAADRIILNLIMATIDRKVDLTRCYAATQDTKSRVKVSGELRLVETNLARLIKQVKTDVPAPMSITSLKAQRAAAIRWDRVRAQG